MTNLSGEIAALLSAPRATTILFASFGNVPGFAVHWDSPNVYALQVEGQKHRRIFEPSLVAPLGRGAASVPGSGAPGALHWEAAVHKGNLL
jgi:ribosomal protein L16 Arg81 hydroxylase